MTPCHRLVLHRARSAPVGASRFALAAFLLLLLTACGAGQGGDAGPEGIDLPRVGTLGRAPGGPGTIEVRVTADGRITVGEEGPLSLIGLRDELQRQTAAAEWREPDRTSMKILLVNADAGLPWSVVCWVMQVAMEPTVGLARLFFGARARTDGRVGALGVALPRSMSVGSSRYLESRPTVTVTVTSRDEPASDPEAILPSIHKAAGKRPVSDVDVHIGLRMRDRALPTGFMVQLIDVARRAGVGRITLGGVHAPPLSDFSDPDQLIRYVAELRARMGVPTLGVNGVRVDTLPRGTEAPPVEGRLQHLVGCGVERAELLPTGWQRSRTSVPEGEESGEGEQAWIAPFRVPVPCGLIPHTQKRPKTFARRGPFPTEDAPEMGLEAALRWLAAHQQPDGGWEAKGFGRFCEGKLVEGGDALYGRADPRHDIGNTGLALCAFLGAGYTNRGKHPFAKTVSKGLRYLKNHQDFEGCFGPRTHTLFLYGHATAALAMVEAYCLTGSPIFKGSAQKALDFIAQAQNAGAGWRYGIKAGENDAHLTAWLALPVAVARRNNLDAAAREKASPLRIAEGALEGALACLDALTDPETGRTAYDAASPATAPTSAALMLRLLLGVEAPYDLSSARVIASRPPAWNADERMIDLDAWHWGTLALGLRGGDVWQAWNAALLDVLHASQVSDGDPCRYHGSWNPAGVRGSWSGRVGTTALAAMCLVARSRYTLPGR